MNIIGIIERYWPLIVMAGGLVGIWATVVTVLSIHGRRLQRHQDWMRRIELSVGNLHEDRRKRDVRRLQIHTPRPPTLSGAQTVEVTDDMLQHTLRQPQNRKDGPG